MDVGIGLPNTIPGTDGRLVVDWARRADGGPFSTLGGPRPARLRLDRPVRSARRRGRRHRARRPRDDDRHRPAAQRGAARQAGGVGGRAVRGPPDAGPRRRVRGSTTTRPRASTTAAAARGCPSSSPRCATATPWASAPTCRCSSAAPSAPRSRAWRATPTATRTTAALRARSPARRRARSPRGATSAAQGARCCGARATSRSATSRAGAAYLRDYYAFTGPFAEKIAAGNLTSARAIRDFVRGYEEAGCDELILFPTVADLDQLERLAEVLA